MRHMLTAADAIEGYVSRGRTAFDADQAIRDAIVYQIVILGEAAKAVLAADPSIEDDLPGVEWSPLARMRDKVTHHYWAIDRELVWATAERDVPAIKALLSGALEKLRD